MIEAEDRIAFQEVYLIINNTEPELVSKIPKSFLKFIAENRDSNYNFNLDMTQSIDKQPLHKKTEDILALIYRSYWATPEEKAEFYKLDKDFYANKNQNNISKNTNISKNINQIFEERKTQVVKPENTELAIVKKESFLKRLFKKIFNFKKYE